MSNSMIRWGVAALLLCLLTVHAWGSGFTTGGVLTSGPGSGNVSTSGTPLSGQVALWTDATTLQGLTTLPDAHLSANIPRLDGINVF